MLKLYGRASSSNVRKVLWVAGEIGVDYTREDWGRGYRSTDEAEFKRVSNFGVVPVIDDDGFILRESNTIVRYLCTKHGRADLYPTDLKARATVEAWMDWGAQDLYAGARIVFLGLSAKIATFQDAKMIETAIGDWTRQMQRLDSELATRGPYLAGVNFTIADIPAGIVVNRWYGIDFPKPALPAVQAYYDRLAERPAYRSFVRNGMA
ncbi:MAG: glutathione S-transferase family protein [Hyphomicrobiaceae bacterium]